MEEKLPVYDLTYRITPEDYEAFNFTLVKDEMKKRGRRSKTLGIFEVAVGALMLISMLTSQAKSEPLYYVLDILLILLGTYSLCFYKYIFPKKLKKAAGENYKKNPYLLNDVHIRIYEDCVHEQSYEIDNIVGWEGFSRIQLTDTLLMLVLSDNKCVIVPLRETGDRKKLEEFILSVHDGYGVKFIKE